MSRRCLNFIRANELSPIVYQSVDQSCVTIRLADGKVFNLSSSEIRQIPHPRWKYAEREMNATALAAAIRENAELLQAMLLEARA